MTVSVQRISPMTLYFLLVNTLLTMVSCTELFRNGAHVIHLSGSLIGYFGVYHKSPSLLLLYALLLSAQLLLTLCPFAYQVAATRLHGSTTSNLQVNQTNPCAGILGYGKCLSDDLHMLSIFLLSVYSQADRLLAMYPILTFLQIILLYLTVAVLLELTLWKKENPKVATKISKATFLNSEF